MSLKNMEIIEINDKYSVYLYILNTQDYDINLDDITEIWYDDYIKSLIIVTNKEVVKMLEFDYFSYLKYIREKKIKKCKINL